MRVAIISPIAWRTPPRHYGPWERVVSLITEGLLKEKIDVTLYATKDSITSAELRGICECGYEEDKYINPKVYECLHISKVFEHANDFDIIHNNFDFLPLTYSGLVKTPVVSTIHGFSSHDILHVYKKYNKKTHYVSISNADRCKELDYIRTVYHGIDVENFEFSESQGNYLLYFGRIHHDKGTLEAIQIAKKSGMKLIIAGIIQDESYYKECVKPYLGGDIEYIGSIGPNQRNEILKNAYCMLHPINFNEPFGLSVVEAMACGTPVIAFNKGSMPEIISDGVNGFLVNNKQAMYAKLADIKNVSRKECRNVIERKFSQQRMVKEYTKVYEEILNQQH